MAHTRTIAAHVRPSLRLAPLEPLALLLAAGCANVGAPPPPEPKPPPPPGVGGDPRAKLPPERFLAQDPPPCCPRLLGGWSYSRVAAPGSMVTGTLSVPGPGPEPGPRVEV